MNVPLPVIAPRARRAAATGDLARVGERLRVRHRDPRADRGCEARDERSMRPVRVEDDSEDRGQRRERAVDQPDHGRLHALKQEAAVTHSLSVSINKQTPRA